MRRLLLGLFHATEAWTIPDAEVERIGREFPDLRIVRAGSREELAAAAPEAEILFSWAPGEDLIARAGRLRWLHAAAAGVGAYLTPTVKARGIVLTSSRGAHGIPIAEHTIGMLLALARRLPAAIQEQTTGGLNRERWYVGAGRPHELHGLTLGLFGYGAIGREIARRAVAFGMKVIALRRHPERAGRWEPELLDALGLPHEEPRVDAVLGPGDLGRLLAESDAVVIAAALTPETEGAFDARAFAQMKRGAYLINVARGKIVRERDLADAVRSGALGGAALDVFETEPLPRESELYTLDNVILTPHISGYSAGFWPRAAAVFRENLRRDLAGLPLVNRVDLARGY
ncbi:MAG: D-2-hydroxyacid dehydrogenase [Candidatus Latescibacteria bacterium]|nr:D-2-hydroxyacid dehydrogenase [Candidatus Latescibacterota bacterium]